MKSIPTLFALTPLLALPVLISPVAANQAALSTASISVRTAPLQLAQMEGTKQRENQKATRPELREGQTQANPTGPASAPGSMGRTPRVDSTTNGSQAIEGTKGQDRQNAVERGKNPATADH